jgi:hypothetical protein
VNEWKVIFATVIIFGTGVIAGGLLVNYADLSHLKIAQAASAQMDASNSVPQITTNGPVKSTNATTIKGRSPEILSRQFVDRLDRDLQLSLDQRADIEKIIAEGQDEMRRAVQNVRQDARQKIREKLNDAQKKQFDDLFKQFHPGKKTNSSTNAPPVLGPTNAPPVLGSTNSLVV